MWLKEEYIFRNVFFMKNYLRVENIILHSIRNIIPEFQKINEINERNNKYSVWNAKEQR